jgi:hypothetical protein
LAGDARGNLWVFFCEFFCVASQVRKRDSESVGKVFGGFVEDEFFEGSPEIQHVALDSAVGVEAAEDRVVIRFDDEPHSRQA